MRNVLFFDSMLTPKIITVVYWIMLAGTALFGLIGIGAALFSGNLAGFFISLFGTAAGLVFTRMWCELLIVLFKINGNLQKVADNAPATNMDSPIL
ncbi:DUF4282 domain-containing protein [Oceanisphaera sp. W20_SRM_FM3]|uniref:DUF4282 domain-containing protein n=1 Tax=Oceanisphaera sp. W20_SRM_FM3 TaxID=3240267 RepID=UPI003F96A13C